MLANLATKLTVKTGVFLINTRTDTSDDESYMKPEDEQRTVFSMQYSTAHFTY